MTRIERPLLVFFSLSLSPNGSNMWFLRGASSRQPTREGRRRRSHGLRRLPRGPPQPGWRPDHPKPTSAGTTPADPWWVCPGGHTPPGAALKSTLGRGPEAVTRRRSGGMGRAGVDSRRGGWHHPRAMISVPSAPTAAAAAWWWYPYDNGGRVAS